MNKRQALLSAIDDVELSLRRLEQMGWKGFDCSQRCLDAVDKWGSPPPSGKFKHRETLVEVRRDLGNCLRCKLSAGRTNIVFGSGSSQARLVFVGEGPGYDEDQQGEPFVGAAGQLLTKIIQAMGLDRKAVYIFNIIKCRPPGNRNPEPD